VCREIGTLHAAATADVRAVQKDLKARDDKWLRVASNKAAEAVKEDFKAGAKSVPSPA